MNLAELCAALPETTCDVPAFPARMLGAFRRKHITFCTGLTDERTVVYWFQSRSFTLDLRLTDGAATPLAARQGWVGDTVWDAPPAQMHWRVRRGYQPREQWPEPASFHFIGNSVLEFAPSGAYVEDWRQQATRGPLLGLRLTAMIDEASGACHDMEGGLIVAGGQVAFARSRLPAVDALLEPAGSLDDALAQATVTASDIESCEVSVAIDCAAVVHSTQPHRLGQPIVEGDFTIESDGSVSLRQIIAGRREHLLFTLDIHRRDFEFATVTAATPEALGWLEREQAHLARHAVVAK